MIGEREPVLRPAPARYGGLAAAGNEICAVSPREPPLERQHVVERQRARPGQRQGEGRHLQEQHQLHTAVPRRAWSGIRLREAAARPARSSVTAGVMPAVSRPGE